MIPVFINKPQFEYDIHSLVKAFYPGEEVKVFCAPTREEEQAYQKDDWKMQEALRIRFEENGMILEAIRGEASRADDKMSSGAEDEAGGDAAAASTSMMQKAEYAPGTERAEVKNILKQLIYRGLSEHLQKELPWGTLTGIRPTKIPMTMLEERKPEEEILDYMKQTYFISDEKGQLSLEIAKREKELLSTLHYKDGYSLYIGIPFCPTTCLYCSFTSYPICAWKNRVGEYLAALEKEMAYVAQAYKDKILDTVYIGGGTPTTLEAEELEQLLSAIEKYFDLSGVQEFTVEAGRADSITREKLKVLKLHNITRISVNPQTMKDETLKLIGRRHTVAQVEEAFGLAREEGFDNINMDIILGLPGETEEDVRHTVEEIKRLHPDSLTVHSLAIKRASKLNQWIEENGMETLHNTDATMEIASGAAADMGMQPYYLYRQKNMSGNFENVGYAEPGKYGIYNILIMEELQTIVALGAGSISKVVLPDGRIERSDNVKDVGLYIERIDEMIQRKEALFAIE